MQWKSIRSYVRRHGPPRVLTYNRRPRLIIKLCSPFYTITDLPARIEIHAGLDTTILGEHISFYILSRLNTKCRGDGALPWSASTFFNRGGGHFPRSPRHHFCVVEGDHLPRSPVYTNLSMDTTLTRIQIRFISSNQSDRHHHIK